MIQAEPRFCVSCGIKRRADPGGRHCHDCMPGGPFTPPPCRRCQGTEDFFASGLCARCHLYGSIRIDACSECHAWGVTRRRKWRCRGCAQWDGLHESGTCRSCGLDRTVNERGICRLCWKNASGHRLSIGGFDPIGGNRHGQQLFFADMQRAARRKRFHRLRTDSGWPEGRPVAHRQLVLFTMAPDLSRGRRVLPPPRDAQLAAALDAVAVAHARRRGWRRTVSSKLRCGIRILLGLQDTPGAPIRWSETRLLPQLSLTARPVIEVLDSVGMFEDDRVPAIDRWFADASFDLPASMTAELEVWFDVMSRGSTKPPRRRPRSPTTIKLYWAASVPALRRWAGEGHDSLREITRAEVLAVLPDDPAGRKMCGQAMRSIFGVLKGRRLIFANPAVRLAHASDSPLPPATVDLDAVRAALNSSDPARAALVALVAFHGLRSHQLRDLQLTDVRDRRLHLDERVIPLAEPVRRRVAAWLDHRARRWPSSTNPHLFIHFRSAAHNEPVGERWVFLTLGLAGGAQALRADRILHEAVATGGDPRRLCDLFGLSIQQASRYTDAIAEPTVPRG